MVKADYCPERGDLIWLHFSPQAGKDQAGHRSALVTKRNYNQGPAWHWSDLLLGKEGEHAIIE